MRKILTFCAAVVLLVAFGRIGYYETHYTMDCLVIYTEDNLVTIVDATGQEWDFEGDGFSVNDVVKATFEECGQSTRFDDKIINVEKMEYAWED